MLRDNDNVAFVSLGLVQGRILSSLANDLISPPVSFWLKVKKAAI